MKIIQKVLLLCCALTFHTTVGSRIVGGSDAGVGEFPWQGSLLYLGSHTCGCVLVHSTWSLTAAHCVEGRSVPSRFRAWFGVHDISDDTQGTKHTIQQIIEHEDYIPVSSYPNDIALLRLFNSVTDANAGVIALDNSAYSHVHSNCQITGWGRTVGGGTIPDILQKANINVITNQQCQDAWSVFQIGDYHICLLDPAGQTSSCQGDSGGPLSCDEGGVKVAGITSWGEAMCTPTAPSVYARVSYFCNWIATNTGNAASC